MESLSIAPRRLLPWWLGAGLCCWAAGAAAQQLPSQLSRMSIEELAEIPITSVSKKAESLGDAAAAVYIITAEDVRRSGATSLAEALRLAPNLEVARTNGTTYAVTARGGSNGNGNKLLVLIDGRVVYNPLNAGVFWEAQDVMMEDVERIEVISGPGGTLWGSNAVNGVINVITRSSKGSQGTLVALGGGNQERGVAVRQGWRLGEDASMRLYAKGFRRDAYQTMAGAAAGDGWSGRQLGFRADWGGADNGATLQGDLYDRQLDQLGGNDRHRSGGNLLGRWNRELADGAAVQVQAYYDHVNNLMPGTLQFRESNDTYDIEAQHRLPLGARHELVWGGGLRLWRSASTNGPILVFLPEQVATHMANLFVQDTIALDPRWKLTLGAKAERNSYTGLEFQPNLRLAWKPDAHALLWAAVSRALRTPSRIDRDFYVYGAPQLPLRGGPNFRSERLTALELGYRAQPTSRLSYSINAFYNKYDDLRTVDAGAVKGTVEVGNHAEGKVAGLEIWGNFQVSRDWRLSASQTLLRERIGLLPGASGPAPTGGTGTLYGNDPAHRYTLRSSHDLPRGMELDLSLNRVAALPYPAVPAYTSFDARLGWHPAARLELALSAVNLLNRRHTEFGSAGVAFERSLTLQLLWKY
ncbi:TonB-dependent receptor plug domain-containing protein [Duganella violaceipulchra]|uniref:Iron complex outermembrane receptor protein n=1 Tax=Duganella violaceipulchra TaxID=2849652 RepID=A0AA41H4E4_9BURK|nr:TonB-dependent receptor [Duganella violaceicalia]MBV6321243.1 TonB-dependent receptor [Duganella violaceicalia]MCP2009509.1 iron complex outermembrane receptor protein [Duganella violaceicalia]